LDIAWQDTPTAHKPKLDRSEPILPAGRPAQQFLLEEYGEEDYFGRFNIRGFLALIIPAMVFDHSERIYIDDLTTVVGACVDVQVALDMGMPMEHQAWAGSIDEITKGLKTCVG
jgi:hypothetical protein